MASTSIESLRVVTFNCHGLRNSMGDVSRLCQLYDVLLLQETWLSKQDLVRLGLINKDFMCHASSPVDLSTGPIIGRPFGGVAILYRKVLSNLVECLPSENDRIVSIVIRDSARYSWLFSSIYKPYFCQDNYDLYMECLADIKLICDSSGCSFSIIGGDFNADTGNEFHTLLDEFCNDESFRIFDEVFFEAKNQGNVATFYSDAHGTSSWLDHIICSVNAKQFLDDSLCLYCRITCHLITSR